MRILNDWEYKVFSYIVRMLHIRKMQTKQIHIQMLQKTSTAAGI